MSDTPTPLKPRGKGRPRLPQDQQVVNKGITLRAEEWAALDRVAAERKITRARLIRELLGPFFDEQAK